MPNHGQAKAFGKYLLLDSLAKGGMAEVFLAKLSGAENVERALAIKVMHPDFALDKRFAAMFIDEANLAGQLTHTNIAQIYDLGRNEGQLFIAMELVLGRNLKDIVHRAADTNAPLPLAFAAHILCRTADALDYAHRKVGKDGEPMDLVHRDVSPQNILVSFDGEVKLVDFGIAKASQRLTRTQVGHLKGKFGYMAPEQLEQRSLDRRADVFNLGTVLYEVVTGAQLFEADADYFALERARKAEIPVLEEVIPDAPQQLYDAMYGALKREPDDRFQYASDFAEVLEPLLIHEQSIFGTREAAQIMGCLFPTESTAEVARARELELRYAVTHPGHTVERRSETAPDARILNAPTEVRSYPAAVDAQREGAEATPTPVAVVAKTAAVDVQREGTEVTPAPVVVVAKTAAVDAQREGTEVTPAPVAVVAETTAVDVVVPAAPVAETTAVDVVVPVAAADPPPPEEAGPSEADRVPDAAASPASTGRSFGELVRGAPRNLVRWAGVNEQLVRGIAIGGAAAFAMVLVYSLLVSDGPEGEELLPPPPAVSPEGGERSATPPVVPAPGRAEQSKPPPAKERAQPANLGYLVVMVQGAKKPVVSVDGENLGAPPLAHMVEFGTHTIVVEDKSTKRVRKTKVNISRKHVRTEPAKITIRF